MTDVAFGGATVHGTAIVRALRALRSAADATPPSGFLIALVLAGIPMVQSGLFEHPAWAPKATLALVLLPPGVVALVRLAGLGDRAAITGILAIAASAISTIRSDRPLLSLVGPPNVGNGLLMTVALVGTWALLRSAGRPTRSAVVGGFLASGTLSSLAAWGTLVSGAFPVDKGGRATAYTGNAVFLGSLAAGTVAYCAAAAARVGAAGDGAEIAHLEGVTPVPSDAERRRWMLAGVAVAAGGVQLTSTRSSAMVVLAVLAWLAVRRRRAALAPIIAAVGGTVVAIVCALAVGTSTVPGRFAARGVADNVRLTMWRAALEALQRSPWWGVGPGRVGVVVAKNFPADACIAYRASDIHNIGLQALVSVGVLGALALAGWVASASRRGGGPAMLASAALGAGALLQPFSVVTALYTVALLAIGTSAVTLPAATRWRAGVGVLMVPTIIAAAMLLVGELKLREASRSADARPYALAHRILPPWTEVSIIGIRANVLDSRLAAERSAEEAIRRDPADEVGWIRLASLQAVAGRADEARANFRHALERNPGSREALASLAKLDGRPSPCPTPP